jgi:hypothetical protein
MQSATSVRVCWLEFIGALAWVGMEDSPEGRSVRETRRACFQRDYCYNSQSIDVSSIETDSLGRHPMSKFTGPRLGHAMISLVSPSSGREYSLGKVVTNAKTTQW